MQLGIGCVVISTEALAGTLVVSRTKAGPTGEMLGRRKLIHVHADLSD